MIPLVLVYITVLIIIIINDIISMYITVLIIIIINDTISISLYYCTNNNNN